MHKLRNKPPSYYRHKASGQAVVSINGRDYYLGLHGSTASWEEYDQLIAEWYASENVRLDYLMGTAIAVIVACLILLPSRVVSAYCVSRGSVCDSLPLRQGRHSSEWGSRV